MEKAPIVKETRTPSKRASRFSAANQQPPNNDADQIKQPQQQPQQQPQPQSPFSRDALAKRPRQTAS